MKSAEQKMIEDLLAKLKRAEDQNKYYRQLLDQNHISYATEERQQSKAEIKPAPVNKQLKVSLKPVVTRETVQLFISVFKGREEFYARRTKFNSYTRPCWNRYDERLNVCPKLNNMDILCRECKYQNFRKLNADIISQHLSGIKEDCSDVIGIYPITKDNTCWFIVFDFDDHNHEKIYENSSHNDEITGKDLSFWNDVRVLTAILRSFSVPYLIERSRSGFGAHVWVFFAEAVPCADARRFGNTLLSEGMKSVNCTSFRTYDRMLPMQDHLEPGQAGNLIALPLQGRALLQGNSAFVDDQFNPYPDQWAVLSSLQRVSSRQLYHYLEQWQKDPEYGESVILFDEEDPTKPWEKDQTGLYPQDVKGRVEIVLANGVYVRKDNLNVRMQNRIRRHALYRNPEFYQAKRRNPEINSMKIPYYIYCGKDIRNYICLPRGCAEDLFSAFEKSSISFDVTDKTEHSDSIKVEFNGELKENQKEAQSALSDKKNGIISAATAFGKTVLGASLIAERKVSALVLVNRSEIMEGWFETFEDFLEINEPLPTYSTKTGRIKTRKTVVGRLGAGKNELNGVIDIAMIQSLVDHGQIKEEFKSLIKNYGMVIVDECHHVSGNEYQILLNAVMAQYVYGFTATPKRYDSQDQKMYFQLGKIRYRFSAKDRAAEQNIDHLVYPRFTAALNTGEESRDYTRMLDIITDDDMRNKLICRDVADCIRRKRTPIILTKRISHADTLYEMLKDKADHVFNMAGQMKTSVRKAMLDERKSIPDDDSVILIATGSKAGEGFNYPRLDTLFMAAPVSWEGLVEQYAGRLNRDYPGKHNVIIYDYVDSSIPMFERMYRKRMHTYSQIGFEICSAVHDERIEKSSIYTAGEYMNELINDIHNAKNEAVIVSPYLSSHVLKTFILQTEELLHIGTTIHIMTIRPESLDEDYIESQRTKICELKHTGYTVTLIPSRKMDSSYAVIDRKIIWYSNTNLLGHKEEDSEVIRFKDSKAATDLLQQAFKTAGRKKPAHSVQVKMDVF